MKVLLIFRDSGRGGTSVEVAFADLTSYRGRDIELEKFEYSDRLGVWENYHLIRATGADVFHITSDIYWLAILLPRTKCVLTIHDIGHYSGMHGLRKWIYRKLFLQWPARRAKCITTVSKFTREALRGVLPEDIMQKVVVIYNPVPILIGKRTPSALPGHKVILQVGTSPHKNCESVIRAMQGLPYTLYIIGALTKTQKDLLNELRIGFVSQQSISYDSVLDAYRNADAVTFISLYEGFGMPVMEAQAMGRPVITSREASLPEIAGDGAHFIQNPHDITEIRRAIIMVMEDKSYQGELIQKGFENVNRFNPRTISKGYRAIYKKSFAG